MVHGFTVGQRYDTQKAPVHFRYPSPPSNPPVRLNDLAHWRVDGLQNPLVADESPVRPEPHGVEILRELHTAWFTENLRGRKALNSRHAVARERRAYAGVNAQPPLRSPGSGRW